MPTEFRTLGVIPARGGSKGIPRKNLQIVAGEPLIAYAIKAAQQSKLLTHFVVSTDDVEIAEEAAALGSLVVQRPPELARDESNVVTAAQHALAEVEQGHTLYDGVILLQPTSPIRDGDDIDNVISMLSCKGELESVTSVYKVGDAHPGRMYRFWADDMLDPIQKRLETAPRQNLPAVYHRNGAIYACRRNFLVMHNRLMGEMNKAYVMPRAQTCNIDDKLDLIVAELLVGLWKDGLL